MRFCELPGSQNFDLDPKMPRLTPEGEDAVYESEDELFYRVYENPKMPVLKKVTSESEDADGSSRSGEISEEDQDLSASGSSSTAQNFSLDIGQDTDGSEVEGEAGLLKDSEEAGLKMSLLSDYCLSGLAYLLSNIIDADLLKFSNTANCNDFFCNFQKAGVKGRVQGAESARILLEVLLGRRSFLRRQRAAHQKWEKGLLYRQKGRESPDKRWRRVRG